MLIDSHCHVNLMIKKEFDIPVQVDDFNKARNIIEAAISEKVVKIINVGTSATESNNCVALARNFKEIYASVGIHPNDLTNNWMEDLKVIKQLIKEKEINKIVAVGECGIDLHYNVKSLQEQKDAFKAQIEIALQSDLAIIVHSRKAKDEILYVLEEYSGQINKCIIHCFSEDLEFANEVIKRGCMIGIGGAVTYPKNNLLREVAEKINLSNILLETDAPYLAPQIIRGQQNHPKNIKVIAEYLAEIRKQSFEEIAYQTSSNALKIFGIED